ncbi:pentatricopeptide repeat-containing protein [Iris pallida]|uniref:Pentatricopeptide repeat-containing protein n=1 Tax=Iris pallida TaxID=29817 RepID=A0AAX6EX31_IRIPA|nr:pentatricopeptide repeat-containing protein [Iris pallida]KAJ6830606.1 pentatricopeptide repeat-containing protein [Iris pallida]
MEQDIFRKLGKYLLIRKSLASNLTKQSLEWLAMCSRNMGMLDKYEKPKKKYPPPSWEYRYIKGKRIGIRVKGQYSLDEEADDCRFAQSMG